MDRVAAHDVLRARERKPQGYEAKRLRKQLRRTRRWIRQSLTTLGYVTIGGAALGAMLTHTPGGMVAGGAIAAVAALHCAVRIPRLSGSPSKAPQSRRTIAVNLIGRR